MITTDRIGDELYVFYRGKLFYKRWIGQDKGRVFHEGEGLTQFVQQESMFTTLTKEEVESDRCKAYKYIL